MTNVLNAISPRSLSSTLRLYLAALVFVGLIAILVADFYGKETAIAATPWIVGLFVAAQALLATKWNLTLHSGQENTAGRGVSHRVVDYVLTFLGIIVTAYADWREARIEQRYESVFSALASPSQPSEYFSNTYRAYRRLGIVMRLMVAVQSVLFILLMGVAIIAFFYSGSLKLLLALLAFLVSDLFCSLAFYEISFGREKVRRLLDALQIKLLAMRHESSAPTHEEGR